MKADLALLVEREAARRGISKAGLTEQAIRDHLEAPVPGFVAVDPRLHAGVENAAARFGIPARQALEGVLRRGLEGLTYDDCVPAARAARARRRARELIGA